MTKILYSLKSIHKIIKENQPSKVCVVTSKQLSKKLAWALKEVEALKPDLIFVPDGETAKEWQELEKLLKKFSLVNLDRNSIVIALGGGTIGDFTGFASSIYLRGIKYINIPTTLLSQVDSSHGGKTGINFLGYKNQVGTFNLPLAVIIEKRFLESLSEENIIDGLGEVIKTGFIKDPSILSILRRHTVSSLVRSPDFLKIIKKSVAVKNYFTGKDLKDNGLRQILNVGHTIGHAVELKYKVSHGRAVLIGMLQEIEFTESLKLTDPSVLKSLKNLLKHLDIDINNKMNAEWGIIIHDKKVTGSHINFPAIIMPGNAKIIRLDLKLLKGFF
ncbi:MAG TPA: 3-dehydroquinate synthase family protein [Candidatus Paceibacterota bacterium]